MKDERSAPRTAEMKTFPSIEDADRIGERCAVPWCTFAAHGVGLCSRCERVAVRSFKDRLRTVDAVAFHTDAWFRRSSRSATAR